MLAFLVSRYYVYRKLNKRKKKKTKKGYDDSLYRYVRKAVFGEYNEVYDDVRPAEIKFFESEDRFNETLSQLSKMETSTFLRTLFFRGQSGLLAAERTIYLSVLDNMPEECKIYTMTNICDASVTVDALQSVVKYSSNGVGSKERKPVSGY